ncbi:immunoglobulin domain-containing protein [Microbacterium sp. 18062]|uniref:immunoglobulin domain-containing protein n=1 Tax=Microbacterium sp. 18062 TaxID=2681410 RepID=UPI001357CE04|nr:immunoglobulin domain-containing protein [Microbacterium sp. 18062]
MRDDTSSSRRRLGIAIAAVTSFGLVATPVAAFADEGDGASSWNASVESLDTGVTSGYQLAYDRTGQQVYIADAQWRVEQKVIGTPENEPFSWEGVTSNSQTSMRTTFSPYGVAVDPDVNGEAVVVTTTARQQDAEYGFGGGVVVYSASQGAPTDADRVFDYADGSPVFSGPRRIAVNDEKNLAYVTSLGDSRGASTREGYITVLDLTKRGTESVIAQVTVPDAAGAVGVAVDEVNDLVYVGGYADNGIETLYVIDGEKIDASDPTSFALNDGAISALPAVVGGNARPTYNAELEKVYVSAYDDSTITVVEGDVDSDAYGEIVKVIDVTTGSSASNTGTNAVEVDAERGLLYSANLDAGVTVYDIANDYEQLSFTAEDGSVYADVQTSGRAVKLAVNEATGEVWVSNWGSAGTVDVIDLAYETAGPAEPTILSADAPNDVNDPKATLFYPSEWTVGEPLVIRGERWTSTSGAGARIAVKLDANGTNPNVLPSEPEDAPDGVWQIIDANADGTFEVEISPFPTPENSWTSPSTPAWEAGTTHRVSLLTGSLGLGTERESVARGLTVNVDLVAAEEPSEEGFWSATVTSKDSGVANGYELAEAGGKVYVSDAQWSTATRDAETGETTFTPGTGKIVVFDTATGELEATHDFTGLRRNDGTAHGVVTTEPSGKIVAYDATSKELTATHSFLDLSRNDGSGKESEGFAWSADSPNSQSSMRSTFSPYGVAVDPDVNGEATIVTTTARQRDPEAAFGGGVVVYSASQGAPTDADRVFRFDDGTPVFAGPRRIAVNDATNQAFVTNLGNSRGSGPDGYITVLDLTKRGADSVVAQITVPDAAGSVGVAVDEANNLIYVGGYADGGEAGLDVETLYVIDGDAIDGSDPQDHALNDGAITALDAVVGPNARPTFSEGLKRVYVSAYDDSVITVVDADPASGTYGTVIDSIEVTTGSSGSATGTNAVEVDAERGLLYSANLDAGVTVYDIANGHEQIELTAEDGSTYTDIPTSGRSVNFGVNEATGEVWVSTWGSTGKVDFITVAESAAPSVLSQPEDAVAVAGSTAEFVATASGSPAPTVQWQASTGDADWTDVAGATAETLEIEATRELHASQYRAVFTNEHGTVTSDAATLTVEYAPVVTSSPLSTSVAVGSDATFTASAEGRPAPAVVWQVKTGDDHWEIVEGATSTTLTVAEVTREDRGNQYRAVFVNAIGEAATAAATLAVDVPKPGEPADWRSFVPADTFALLEQDAGGLTAVQNGTTVTISGIDVADGEWVHVFGYSTPVYLDAFLVNGGSTTVSVAGFGEGTHHLAVYDASNTLLGHVPFVIAADGTGTVVETPAGATVLAKTGMQDGAMAPYAAAGALALLLGLALVAIRVRRARTAG